MKKSSSLFLLVSVFAIIALSGSAQNKTNDWGLVMNSGLPDQARKTTVTKGIFHRVIQPQMASSCNFEFDCSSFGPAMVKRYSLPKGSFLTIDRWIRCTKISVLETYSIRLTAEGKIKESPEDFYKP